MKRLLRSPALFVALGLLFAGCDASTDLTTPETASSDSRRAGPADVRTFFSAAEPINPSPGEVGITDLIAGQHLKVGVVRVAQDGDQLRVTYEITTGGWCIVETHLEAQDDPSDFPTTKKGNPRIGNFAHSGYHSCEPSVDYLIPLPYDAGGDGVHVAAHAVVESGAADIAGLESLLPATTPFRLDRLTPRDSYLDVTISQGSILDGIRDAWCIDLDRQIVPNRNYGADVYSSYSAAALAGLDGKLEKPENLDLINWILNQDFVGSTSSTGETVTYGDVQRAIWTLIEDENSNAGLGPYSQARANEIVAAALNYGEGFAPACGDQIAVILVPGTRQADGSLTSLQQVLILTIPVPCDGTGDDETAWGAGTGFPGSNWAMYFGYLPSAD